MGFTMVFANMVFTTSKVHHLPRARFQIMRIMYDMRFVMYARLPLSLLRARCLEDVVLAKEDVALAEDEVLHGHLVMENKEGCRSSGCFPCVSSIPCNGRRRPLPEKPGDRKREEHTEPEEAGRQKTRDGLCKHCAFLCFYCNLQMSRHLCMHT